VIQFEDLPKDERSADEFINAARIVRVAPRYNKSGRAVLELENGSQLVVLGSPAQVEAQIDAAGARELERFARAWGDRVRAIMAPPADPPIELELLEPAPVMIRPGDVARPAWARDLESAERQAGDAHVPYNGAVFARLRSYLERHEAQPVKDGARPVYPQADGEG